jgi:tRNA dimethylallyltransferase
VTARPVAIIGSTASGKSSLAMAVAAERRDVEIIAVDSMQVYRGMDIGTAKPTAHDQARVRHHGIDLADPSEAFAVVQFVEAYDRAVATIAGRPIVVAGTGLYLRAVLDRIDPPGTWPELRERFETDPDLPALFRRLEELDPIAASRIDVGNRRRIVRALEVCVGSGRAFSSFGPGLDVYPPIGVVQVGLRWDRAVLTRRINERVDAMVAAGLVDEVRNLATRSMSHTARQALGYKELLDHLDGRCSLNAAIAAIKLRTRQFAVRQDRWFRRDPRITWIDVQHDSLEALPQVVELLSVASAP